MRLLTLIFILADSALRLIDAQTKPRITLIMAQYNDQPAKVTTKFLSKYSISFNSLFFDEIKNSSDYIVKGKKKMHTISLLN